MYKKSTLFSKKTLRLVSMLICLVMLLSACSPAAKTKNEPTSETIDLQVSKLSTNDKEKDELQITVDPKLKKVGSYKKFVKLLKNNKNFSDKTYGIRGESGIAKVEETAVTQDISSDMGLNDSSSSSNKDYSTTNNQVKSVDEADIVKTDGKYFYYINGEQITVVETNEAGELKVSGEVKFTAKENTYFYPNELLLDGNILIAIGTYYETYVSEEKEVTTQSEVSDDITYDIAYGDMYMPRYIAGKNMTKVICYDVTDKSNIKEIRTIEIDGDYVTSRKIGNNVYLVSNKYFDYYRILNETGVKKKEVLPAYKDSAISAEYKTIASKSILYYEDFDSANYMTIAGFDISNMDKSAELTTILGAAQNVYVSENNMYIAKVNYHYNNSNVGDIMPLIAEDASVITEESTASVQMKNTYDTDIYRLALSDGKAIPTGSSNIPGSLINQFSMDEYDGYFRVATTTGETWNEQNTSYNHLYVLDEQLNIAGRLENLAAGERIYSTRFMGNKLYMVTFKQVDPLFVIDISNPKKPVVAGELKLPGYSSYLQAYDENHIIGIGYDTRVVTENYNGETWERVQQLGLKIAMFDVSDMSNPKLLHEIIVGDQGTSSEALYNHKAVLFSRDKNLFALPISVSTTTTDSKGNITYNHEAQAAYVYNISVKDGFVPTGTIKHERTKNEHGYYDYNNEIKRIQYIGDKLYTFTNAEIKSSNINTLKSLFTLKIK